MNDRPLCAVLRCDSNQQRQVQVCVTWIEKETHKLGMRISIATSTLC